MPSQHGVVDVMRLLVTFTDDSKGGEALSEGQPSVARSVLTEHFVNQLSGSQHADSFGVRTASFSYTFDEVTLFSYTFGVYYTFCLSTIV